MKYWIPEWINSKLDGFNTDGVVLYFDSFKDYILKDTSELEDHFRSLINDRCFEYSNHLDIISKRIPENDLYNLYKESSDPITTLLILSHIIEYNTNSPTYLEKIDDYISAYETYGLTKYRYFNLRYLVNIAIRDLYNITTAKEYIAICNRLYVLFKLHNDDLINIEFSQTISDMIDIHLNNHDMIDIFMVIEYFINHQSNECKNYGYFRLLYLQSKYFTQIKYTEGFIRSIHKLVNELNTELKYKYKFIDKMNIYDKDNTTNICVIFNFILRLLKLKRFSNLTLDISEKDKEFILDYIPKVNCAIYFMKEINDWFSYKNPIYVELLKEGEK